MVVAVQQPQQRDDASTAISQALNVASTIFGVTRQMQANRIAGEQRIADQQRTERQLEIDQAKAQTSFLDKFRPAQKDEQGIEAPTGLGLPKGNMYVQRPQVVPTGSSIAQERFEFQKSQAMNRDAREVQKEIKSVTKDLKQSKVPEMIGALKNIDNAIEGGIDGDDDISGSGQTGSLPEFMLTQKGKDVRRAIANFRNKIISAQAGANVSANELKRMMEEVGTGVFRTDADLRRALKNARNILLTGIQNAEAGMSPDALEQYYGVPNAVTSMDPLFDESKQELMPKNIAGGDQKIPPGGKYAPGTVLNIQGRQMVVGADGKTATEVSPSNTAGQ